MTKTKRKKKVKHSTDTETDTVSQETIEEDLRIEMDGTNIVITQDQDPREDIKTIEITTVIGRETVEIGKEITADIEAIDLLGDMKEAMNMETEIEKEGRMQIATKRIEMTKK